MSVFSENVENLLKNKGISQKNLSDRLGINKSAVNHWKNGAMPSIEIGIKIAQEFGVSVEWLVTGRDAVSETFSREEVEIVRKWRAIKDDDRQTVALLLNTFYEKTQTALEKKMARRRILLDNPFVVEMKTL